MKTALVISGGGSKGAFAVGAVEVLRERGITFDMIVGTSTGALIAPLVAVDDIDELVKQYTTIKTRDIIRKNWRHFFYDGYYHTRPLEKRIRRIMDGSRYEKLMNSKSPLILLCAVSLQTRKVMYFGQRAEFDDVISWETFDKFVGAMIGSMSQPTIMTVPVMGGHQLVDGGVREIAPISIAARAGIRKIYVVINSPEKPSASNKFYSNALQIGMRTLDLMTDEIVLNDVRMAEMCNEALITSTDASKVIASKFVDKHLIEIVIIRPKNSLPSDGLSFDPKTMQIMREMGKKEAREKLDRFKG